MANFIDRLMAAFAQTPSVPAIPGNPALGVPGVAGSPSGPAATNTDKLQDTPVRQMLSNAIARARALPQAATDAANTFGAVSNMAGNADRIRAAIAPPAGGGAQAAPAVPLPDLPGTTVGRPQGPTDASMAGLMQQPQSAPPPVPMPKSFAAPVNEAQGNWNTTVKSAAGTNDVRTFLRALAGGAANNNPGSKIGGFFRGMSGALEGREAIKDKDAATALAADERAYRRGRDASADARANAKEKREARESTVKMQKMQAEIQNLIDPKLSIKDRLQLSTDATNYGINLIKSGGLNQEEALEATRKYLKEKQGYVESGNVAGEPVKVSTPEEAMKLAPGTKFLTPDGQLKVR